MTTHSKTVEAAAAAGNPDALFALGWGLALGYGGRTDLDAAAYLERAAARAHPLAAVARAWLSLHAVTHVAVNEAGEWERPLWMGQGPEEYDSPEALLMYRQVAEQGHAEGQYQLALLHLRGCLPRRAWWSVQRSFADWLSRQEGRFYGQHLPESFSSELQQLDFTCRNLEAERDLNAYALNDLAVLHDDGWYVSNFRGQVERAPSDQARAMRLYLRAAKKGNPYAAYNLGIKYLEGHAVDRDLSSARKWLTRAANKGHGLAALRLGQGHEKSSQFVDARVWYGRAWDDSFFGVRAQAAYALFQLYSRNSVGVNAPKKAHRWLREAAQAGHLDAQYTWGLRLYDGEHGPPDANEAYSWFRRAADAGHGESAWMVGWCCASGNGTAQNREEARWWYRRASDLAQNKDSGSADGIFGWADDFAPATSTNRSEALRWLRRAAQQGHPGAQLTLGRLHAEGALVVQDFQTAHIWFNLAASAGWNPYSAAAASARAALETKMCRETIAQAQLRARELELEAVRRVEGSPENDNNER